MKKFFTLLTFAIVILFFSQCNQQKPAAASADPVLTTPEANAKAKTYFGGYDSKEKWGEHLVLLGGCNDCHTPTKMGPKGPELAVDLLLSGAQEKTPSIIKDFDRKSTEAKGLMVARDNAFSGPWGVSFAANLTPDDSTGTGTWTEDRLVKVLREGKYHGLAESRDILPPMPWEMYKNMTNDEISAVFAYLKSIKPVKNHVPAPIPPVAAMMAKPKK